MVTVPESATKSAPTVAVPLTVYCTANGALVSPLRLMVTRPSTGPASLACATDAVTLTWLAGVTVTTTVSVAVPPPSSVTSSVSVCAPIASETAGVAPVARGVLPSRHSKVAMLPSRSEDPLPSSVTGATPSRVRVGHGLVRPGIGQRRQVRQAVDHRIVEVQAAVDGPRVQAHRRHALAVRTVQEDVDDLAVGGDVAARPDQRRGAGDVRRRHRRAGIPGIAAGVAGRRRAVAPRQRIGRHDEVARCRNVNPAAVVRERRALVIFVEGADGDDVVERRRVERQRRAVVAGAADDHEAGVPGILHGVVERLREDRVTQAHVDDLAPSVTARAIACCTAKSSQVPSARHTL